jgi:fusion and transport protein UGO1
MTELKMHLRKPENAVRRSSSPQSATIIPITMATSRDPNPLRPYYIPPTVEPLPAKTKSNSTGAAVKNRASSAKAASTSKPGYGSSAREMLSDLDYSEYLSDGSPSITEMIKTLMDQGLWKYTSVLFAQPFEVAKTVLQVQDAGAIEQKSREKATLPRHTSYRHDRYEVLRALTS